MRDVLYLEIEDEKVDVWGPTKFSVGIGTSLEHAPPLASYPVPTLAKSHCRPTGIDDFKDGKGEKNSYLNEHSRHVIGFVRFIID